MHASPPPAAIHLAMSVQAQCYRGIDPATAATVYPWLRVYISGAAANSTCCPPEVDQCENFTWFYALRSVESPDGELFWPWGFAQSAEMGH